MVKLTPEASEPSICLAVNMASPATDNLLALAIIIAAGISIRTSPDTSDPLSTRVLVPAAIAANGLAA